MIYLIFFKVCDTSLLPPQCSDIPFPAIGLFFVMSLICGMVLYCAIQEFMRTRFEVLNPKQEVKRE